MLQLTAICYNGMNACWDIISQRVEEWWLQADAYSSGNWGAPKFTWFCLNSMAGDWKLALLWQLVSLFEDVLSKRELSRFSLFKHHSWWKWVPIIWFQITVLAAETYKLVRIELSRNSKHWKQRPYWVSKVHGWAGVAGHLAELLNRICLLRFSLCSSTSFDRPWACRSYFMISKHRSKHTT
jgi:hypothetical protein